MLDSRIEIDENKPLLSFHHKLSHLDTVIHNNASSLLWHDFTSFETTLNLQEELNIIKLIVVNNGYDVSVIDTILRKELFNKTMNMI